MTNTYDSIKKMRRSSLERAVPRRSFQPPAAQPDISLLSTFSPWLSLLGLEQGALGADFTNLGSLASTFQESPSSFSSNTCRRHLFAAEASPFEADLGKHLMPIRYGGLRF